MSRIEFARRLLARRSGHLTRIRVVALYLSEGRSHEDHTTTADARCRIVFVGGILLVAAGTREYLLRVPFQVSAVCVVRDHALGISIGGRLARVDRVLLVLRDR